MSTPAFAAIVAQLEPAARAALEVASADLEWFAEACWRSHDPKAEVVAGWVDAPHARLIDLARDLAPRHADRVARWLAATPGIVDLGCKVGHHGLQLYARGAIPADAAIAGFTAAGVAVHPPQVRNLLALVERPALAMIGLELGDDGEAIDGAIYAAVPRTRHTAGALQQAAGFLVRVVAPDQLPVWDAVAPVLFDAPPDEIVYVSLSATNEFPWAKIDVGARPLALAGRLGDALGLGSLAPVVRAARAHAGTAWSHVGVRFGSSLGPVFYLPIAGDRD